MRYSIWKWMFAGIWIFIFVISLTSPQLNAEETQPEIIIHYFFEQSCPNCRQISEFLDDYLEDMTHIVLIRYDVLRDPLAEASFLTLIDLFDHDIASVPFIVVGGTSLQGLYQIKADLPRVIQHYELRSNYVDVVAKIFDQQMVTNGDLIPLDLIGGRSVTLPVIGEVDLKEFSLLLGAILIGLIDGFNPCAMWILLFLITLLIQMKDRKKMWILGLTFILTSGLVYYVIMISWLQIALKVATIRGFQIGIGILAMVFAVYSFRHFYHQIRRDIGCEVTSLHQKKRLMDRARRIITKNNVWLSVIGIAGLAISVNVIELACSAGLPVIFTTMLAYHDLTGFQFAMYILIYVLFFILDDLLVFTIAAFTFRVKGISMKYEKYSSLIGGLIMVTLAILLIFFPGVLI